MRWIILFLFLGLIGVTACKKENNISKVPQISFQSLNHNTVKSGSSEDSINISFKFEDGDADLGNDPQSGKYDIFVTDSRDTATQFNFFLPGIPEDFKDPAKGITGYATVSIKAAFLVLDSLHLGGDSLHYEVYMKDIAGNESNHFITPKIYITP